MVALSHTGEFEPLLAAAREDDPVAFRKLSDRYLAGLTAFAKRRNAEDPEEIANAVLYDGFSNLYRFRSHTSSSFRSYLFQCAANRINTEHRKVKPILVPLTDDCLQLPSTLEETDDVVGGDWFNNVIVALPVDQKAVIEERFGKGNTIAETAHRLGKSADSIKNLQERALHRLRRDLALAGAVVALIVLAAVVLSIRSNRVVVESTPADRGESPVLQVDRGGDDVPRLVTPEGARSTSEPTIAPSDGSSSARTSIFSVGSTSVASGSTESVAETSGQTESPVPVVPVEASSSSTVTTSAPAPGAGSITSIGDREPQPSASTVIADAPEGEDRAPDEVAGDPQTADTSDDSATSSEAPGEQPGNDKAGKAKGGDKGKSGDSSDGPGKSSEAKGKDKSGKDKSGKGKSGKGKSGKGKSGKGKSGDGPGGPLVGVS